MNVFALLFCICALVLQAHGETEETAREEYDRIVKKCQDDPSTHIDINEVTKFDNGEEVDHSKLGPFLLCLNTGLNLQDKNGNTSPQFRQVMAEVIPDHETPKFEKFIETCGIKSAESPEEAAIDLSRCMTKYYPELNLTFSSS